jgi:hypothetical protein
MIRNFLIVGLFLFGDLWEEENRQLQTIPVVGITKHLSLAH